MDLADLDQLAVAYDGHCTGVLISMTFFVVIAWIAWSWKEKKVSAKDQGR